MDIPASNKKTKVTKADNTELPDHKGVLIMGAGDVAIRYNSGDAPETVTYPAMSYIPFKVYSIDSTNTTATAIFILM